MEEDIFSKIRVNIINTNFIIYKYSNWLTWWKSTNNPLRSGFVSIDFKDCNHN